MSLEYDISKENRQEEVTHDFDEIERLTKLLEPLLVRLDAYLDIRLVRTLVETVAAILLFRHSKQGLHVSQLGTYIKDGEHAPAGTKKLERLLHSKKWKKSLIDDFYWERAEKKVGELAAAGKRALCIWDGSRLEKPESEKTEGMGSVLSSKAKRLRKNREGIWNEQGGKPITVLGIEWTGLLLAGMQGIPEVIAMEYWSRKGEHATTQREVDKRLLWKVTSHFGKKVIHVLDRGYAGAPWLEALNVHKAPFVIRWPGRYHFLDQNGEEKALWMFARGKRTWSYRMVEDTERKGWMRRGVVAVPIRHAAYAGPLWLVVGRGKKDPWYIVTNMPVETDEQAWEIIMIYTRRWKIEEMFRFQKSEMGVESVCVKSWEAREKLLSLVTLAYIYLLSLCDPDVEQMKARLLRQGCHRTGKRCQEAKTPLYRLRWAISSLWGKINHLSIITSLLPTFYSQNICSKSSG
jgi:Transposase DDE domain